MFQRPACHALVLAAALVACAATAAKAAVFEIIALPDTENYLDSNTGFPGLFGQQTQWVVDNLAAENIVFVTHLGDMIHHNPTLEMPEAAAAMAKFDQPGHQVPYSASAGNHELESSTSRTIVAQNFGASRYSQYSWYGGSYNTFNHYQIFSAGGYDFLHINLQFDPDANTLIWAQGVINANLGKPTIISTHDYLTSDTSRSTAATPIWTSLVQSNPQVFLTLNGHTHPAIGVARMLSTNSGNKTVLQVMNDFEDYTTQPAGATNTGYLRKIIFDTQSGKITFKTYSPTYTAVPSLTDANHQFSCDMAFLPQSPGSTLGPIFVTDAASCAAAGYSQNFDSVPGPTGTALPTGWTAWQIAGTGSTFSNANPIQPANVAAATATGKTLLVAAGAPAASWGNQLANAPNGAGRAVATNPGNVGAGVIQFKASNGLGTPVSSVRLSYALGMLWSHANDVGSELPGYSLFWSRTGGGAAADWTKLGEDSAAGAKVWNVTLSTPLAPGADLYFRWADDNVLGPGGENAPENVWSIDNVRLSMSAVPYVWNGGAQSDNRWTTAANWGGTPPVAGRWLSFGAAGANADNSNDFTAGTRFNGITFAAGAPAFDLRGNAIKLGGPVVNEGDAVQTIRLTAVELAAGGGTMDTGSGDMVIAAPISGKDMGLTKSGSGTLRLDGENSYSGGTTVLEGTLEIDQSGALPLGGGLVIAAHGEVVFHSGLGQAVQIGDLLLLDATGSPLETSLPTTAHLAAGFRAVPEPSALALLGVGVLSLLVCGYRSEPYSACAPRSCLARRRVR